MSAMHCYCHSHGGFYPKGGTCPNCPPRITLAGITYGHCNRHGDYAGGPCAECAAEQQPADPIQARLSVHHALWMAHGHDITLLKAAENRQDAALTDLEAGAADLNALYDRVAELERKVNYLTGLLAPQVLA